MTTPTTENWWQEIIQNRLVELNQYEKNLVKMMVGEILSQELSRQREEWIEKVTKMKGADFFESYHGGYIQCECGQVLQTQEANFEHREHLNWGNHYFNQALDEILNLLR